MILIRKIISVKEEHRIKLDNLHIKLSLIKNEKESAYQKVKLDNNINRTIFETKRKLNEEIFDLQVEVFRKISESQL